MKKKYILLLLLPFLILLLIFYSLILPPSPYPLRKVEIYIPHGYSSSEIALLLKKKNLIKSPPLFKLIARITGLHNKLKSGYYLIKSNETAIEILKKIASGEFYTIKVTIPEGFSVPLIAERLVQKGLIKNKKEFYNGIKKLNIKKRFSFIPVNNPEGFLYPDTYYFVKGTPVSNIIIKMITEFSNKVLKRFKTQIANSRFSLYEIITLASLIEKETGVDAERPVIAQVFIKRLKKGYKLFCDPTVAYAVGKYHGERLTYRDLKFDSPYNTYLYKGLPPTPICNPGIKSIEAVLNPAKTDYLYFVSKNDGTHKFSRTLKEHNLAVEKYQKRKK